MNLLREAPEESPNFFDERFDFEEPFDLLESSEPPALDQPKGESEETTEKRPRRRRRRRGRGRGTSERRPREERTAGEDRSEQLAADSTEAADRRDAADEDQPRRRRGREEGAMTPEAEQRRGKRRRPRRGRKRRAPESATSDADQGADADVLDADMLDSDLLPQEDHEVDEVEDKDGQEPARLGFRGIPTWSETVGLLINKKPGGPGEASIGQSAARPQQAWRPRQAWPRRQAWLRLTSPLAIDMLCELSGCSGRGFSGSNK